MHAVWDIPELLLLVLEEVRRNCSYDLETMALVCRFLWEAATPLIWEYMFIPLEGKPSNERRFWSFVSDKTAVGPGGSTMLQFYGQFVRSIHLTFFNKNKGLFAFLTSNPLSTLFPNLHELELSFTHNDSAQPQIDSVLDGLNLHYLSIWIQIQVSDPHMLITSMLQCVLKQKELTYFKFGGRILQLRGEALIVLENLMAQVILSLPQLRTLSLGPSGLTLHPLWLAASQSASLKFFKFCDTNIGLGSARAAPRSSYSLQTVEVRSTTVEAFGHLLESLVSADLRTLCLSIEHCSRGNVDGAIVHCARFSSLRSLSLKLGGATATWTGLSSLLSCILVEKVHLEAKDLDTLLTDAVVCTVAKAWPQIHSLRLRVPRPEQEVRPPAATLRGISTFAKHCPHLEELCISVDARGVGGDPPAQSSDGAIFMNLLLSWADKDVRDIATFIARTWPRMKGSGFTVTYNALPEGQRELWRRIATYMHKYQREAATVVFDW